MLEIIVVSATYADQFTPSVDVDCCMTYCLIALVPGTVPLHERFIVLASYIGGFAAKIVGGMGSMFLRTVLLEIVQSE
ncbi:conserved hypothetical protein [Bacillus cereus ATCC 10987]|uniref:Uncharacterized protein n=1 Tax=Bacillus cereus (strain ATCC 10987 / NRS 248) TaxID=222523 RepID=Q73EE5_BACC1|nr:conserved hypothetical protein [Bacillus cereus ATCC 10987]